MARTKQMANAARAGAMAQKAPRKVVAAKAAAAVKKVRRTDTPAEEEKKKRRWHPGTVALREIRKMQKSADLVIPRAPFARLVHEIVDGIREDTRVQAAAIEALREASEAYLTRHLELAQMQAIHAKRITVMAPDSRLVANVGAAMAVPTYMDLGTDTGRFVPRDAPRPAITKTKAPRKQAVPKKNAAAAVSVPAADADADADTDDKQVDDADDADKDAANEAPKVVMTE